MPHFVRHWPDSVYPGEDYQNWNLGTLRAIADALDARLRVVIEPAEDVIAEYDDEEELSAPAATAGIAHSENPVGFRVRRESIKLLYKGIETANVQRILKLDATIATESTGVDVNTALYTEATAGKSKPNLSTEAFSTTKTVLTRDILNNTARGAADTPAVSVLFISKEWADVRS